MADGNCKYTICYLLDEVSQMQIKTLHAINNAGVTIYIEDIFILWFCICFTQRVEITFNELDKVNNKATLNTCSIFLRRF